MRRVIYGIVLVVAACVSCSRQPLRVEQARSEAVAIDGRLDSLQDTVYLQVLQPIRDSLERQLDIALGYAPEDLKVYRPECPLLNWATDALYEMAVQVTGSRVDFAVVNIFGLRTDWGKGAITFRQVFELMPFDNRLVILTLTGQDVLDLCDCFAMRGGEGISHTLRMQMKDGKAVNVRLNGEAIDPAGSYYVATSDYLSTGADQMVALARYSHKEETDLRIRDLYIQYIQQQTAEGKPIKAVVDNRMQQI